MTTLFISDLHLTPQRPETTELFFGFMREEVPGADALYVLGDLFEYWIGDDAAAHFGAEPIFYALRHATRGGVPIYFIAGNRDFLIGEKFCEHTGVTLLPDESVIELYGHRVLVLHGDSLCSDDVAHQQFRATVLDAGWQTEFLALPVEARIDAARQARGYSEQNKQMLSAEIMDVNPGAVTEALRREGVRTMIHGHTHRPAIHRVEAADNPPAQRIVLGDWYDQASMLRVSPDGLELHARGAVERTAFNPV